MLKSETKRQGSRTQFLAFVKWCLRHWVIFQVTVLKSGMVLCLVQQIRMNVRTRRRSKDWHILMIGEVRWDCLANKRENSFLRAGISLTSLCTCLMAGANLGCRAPMTSPSEIDTARLTIEQSALSHPGCILYPSLPPLGLSTPFPSFVPKII